MLAAIVNDDLKCLQIYFRQALKSSNVPRYFHSAVFVGDVMLVFGGNSHNGTVQMPSNLPCFSMDFLAYDRGTTGMSCKIQWKLFNNIMSIFAVCFLSKLTVLF